MSFQEPIKVRHRPESKALDSDTGFHQDREELVANLDAHMRMLRHADTQATAVAWMKTAHELLRRCANELDRPHIYSVPGHFGAPTFMLAPPKPLVLPAPGFRKAGPVWLNGATVVYNDSRTAAPPKNSRAWTRKDTLRLERDNMARNAPTKVL
jgi:hypothetical protein